jgi:hypothetical protein
VPAEKILSALSDILQEHGAYNSNDSISIIKFLLHDFAKKHPELDESVGRIVSVFMFVAPTANKNALLKKLPKSGTANSKLLKSMVNDLKTSLKEGEKGDYIAFIKLLAKSTGSVSTDLWINMVKSNLAAENSVGLLVLSHAVVLSEGSKQHSLCSAFLDAILYFIGKKNSLFYTSELPSEFRKVENGLPSDQVIDNFRHINKVTTSDIIQLVQFAVLGLTVNTKRTSGAIEWFNVKSSDDKYPQFLIKLFKTLVGGSHLGSFEYAITELIKGHLRDDILCFLTSIWTNNGKFINIVIWLLRGLCFDL